MRREPPLVLIVGAGPTGLALACDLARHGTRCRIVDMAGAPSTESRALGIQARTLEVLAQSGVADDLIARGERVRAANLYLEGRRARLSFQGLASPYPFVLTLPQAETERILAAHLRRSGIDIERETELVGIAQDADGVGATLRHAGGRDEPVRAAWVVGCDGARSAVRRLLDLPFSGARYEEEFCLADAPLRWTAAPGELHVFVGADALLAVVPLPAGLHRLIASPGLGVPDREPGLEDFQALMDRLGPPDTRLGDAVWISRFRIQRRLTPRLRVGRVLLAGDAAHIHSPAGGQGMNTGIQDAHNLAWKLALVTAGLASPALLDSYEAERLPVARAVLRGTDRLTRVVLLRNPVLRLLRNVLIPLALAIPRLHDRVRNTVAELDVAYPRSPIVGERIAGPPHARQRIRRGPRAGARLPHAAIVTDGRPGSLFELLRDPRHVALVLTGRTGNVARASELADRLRSRYSRVLAVHVIAPAGASRAAGVIEDPDGALHRRLGAAAACLYVVRPDGYLGLRSLPADAAALSRYVARILTEDTARPSL